MTARAAFHLWNIREIYTDSTGSKQFIEFFTSFGGQQFVGGQSITVSSGGTNHTFTIPSHLPSDSASKAFVIATSGAQSSGAPTADYIISDNFLFAGGGTISFFGANSGAYTNIPTDGVFSRTWDNGNATNSPENFAGQVGMVTNSDLPPSISITNPPNGSIFSAPATFTLAATASDPGGAVNQVEFFQGGTSLGVIANSPYSVGVSNLTSGVYMFSAVATDNIGDKATNSISVTVNALPTVTITNPPNSSVFNEPASFTLAASASDSDGSVSQVKFFRDGTLLATITNSPYSLFVSNLIASIYTFSAVVTDNNDAKATNSISVTINALPTVAITNPPDGSVFSELASFTLAATASDSGGGSISQVEFFRDSASLGIVTNNPFSIAVSNLAEGVYIFSATATDNNSAKATNSISVTVNGPVPIVISNMDRSSFMEFRFTFTANPGLTYVVERSAMVTNFLGISTNVAGSSSVNFTDVVATAYTNFYRVVRVPGP